MDSCRLDVIGKDYKNFLIIFPIITSQFGTSVAAAASTCLTDPDTNRPLMGILYIGTILDEWLEKLANGYEIYNIS